MAKALQPYVGFIIVFNEKILLKSKIFTIDSLIANNGLESATLLEI